MEQHSSQGLISLQENVPYSSKQAYKNELFGWHTFKSFSRKSKNWVFFIPQKLVNTYDETQFRNAHQKRVVSRVIWALWRDNFPTKSCDFEEWHLLILKLGIGYAEKLCREISILCKIILRYGQIRRCWHIRQYKDRNKSSYVEFFSLKKQWFIIKSNRTKLSFLTLIKMYLLRRFFSWIQTYTFKIYRNV